jgi:hypothetical protein
MMDDEAAELIAVGNWAKQNGYMHAAFILGKAGAESIRAARKPRKKGVKVRLTGGGYAVLDKALVDRAEEWNEGD